MFPLTLSGLDDAIGALSSGGRPRPVNDQFQDGRATVGLVLTGGGARSAYQVGVLKGVAEILGRGARQSISDHHRNFRRCRQRHRPRLRPRAFPSRRLCHREGVARVPRAPRVQGGPGSMLRSGSALDPRTHYRRLAGAPAAFAVRQHAALGAAAQEPRFRRYPARHVQAASTGGRRLCDQLSEADSVTFYACAGPIEPWKRAARKGARVQLTLDHLMASLSIPFLFRPVLLHQQYFGDGAMRQTLAPEPGDSPRGQSAVHHRGQRSCGGGARDAEDRAEPSFGQMFGFMLDSLFMDQLKRIWSAHRA